MTQGWGIDVQGILLEQVFWRLERLVSEHPAPYGHNAPAPAERLAAAVTAAAGKARAPPAQAH